MTTNSKLVFIDIDGTLADENHVVPESAKIACKQAQVVPEFLRTLVFARPRGDDQFADCTFSPSLDMSR